MKPQPLHDAIASEHLAIELGVCTDEPKSSLRDLLTSCGQVGAALSLCWMVHIFA